MYHSKLFTLICLILSTAVMRADDDDFGFGSEDPFNQTEVARDPLRQSGSCALASQIVPVLAESDAVQIFEQNFFLGTAPLANRDVLDFPIWQRPLPSINRWNFSADFFFNKTDRSVFNSCNAGISAVLGFENTALLNAVDTAIKNIINNPNFLDIITSNFGGSAHFFDTVNVPYIASLFTPLTIQQRRAGVLLSITENRERWTGDIRMPVYYLERNAWITDADRIPIEAAFPKSDSLSNAEIEEFAREHIVADKWGIGDLRFTLAYQLIENQTAKLHVAGLFTAPTAATFQRGLLGGSFQCPPDPNLDFCALLDMADELDAVKKKLRYVGETFLDRFSAVFLEEELGNRKHWGFGGFIEPIVNLNDSIKWHARLFGQGYIQNSEKRYFVQAANLTDFTERDFTSADIDIAASNLQFLGNRLVDMLFPIPLFPVHVRPGPVVMLLNEFLFQFGHWDASVGIDWWHQGGEHLTLPSTNLTNLLITQAAKGPAEQIKALGSLGYTFRTTTADWNIGARGDGTLYNKGIGKDWTVALSLGISW